MKIHRPFFRNKKYNAHRQTMRVVLYHVRSAAWYNRPSGQQRAAPAYRPAMKDKINALRLFYHILIFPAMQDLLINLARLNPAEKQRDSMQGRFAAF